MMNMTTTIKTLVLAGMMFANKAATNQADSKLIGSWKVIGMHEDFPGNLTPDEKFKSEISFNKQEKMFKASPFVFGANGELTVMGKTATWQLSKDQRTFKIILMKDEGLRAKIISLTKTKLVFKVTDHDVIETFTLGKIN